MAIKARMTMMTMTVMMMTVMTFFKANGKNESYAFTGPLSMHKGCDKAGPQSYQIP